MCPLGTRLGNVHFVLDICHQQLGEMCQLEGFCAFCGCRPCTALQGEGTYIFVIYVFVLDICCQYLGNILSGAQLSGAQLSGVQLSGAQLSGAQFA